MAAYTLALALGVVSLTGPAASFGDAVMYATVEDGVVTAVSYGILPDSTDTVLYVDLSRYDPQPQVDWYFSDICQTFDEAPPTIPPGDVAPPFTPGGTPPTPGGPNYPEVGGDPGPAPLASTAPMLVSFHADGETSLTYTTSSAAEEELDVRMRTAIDLTDVCAVRVQGYVETALAGAEVVIFASDDDGYTWDELSPGKTGPTMALDAVGNVEGLYLNVDPIFAGEVLLSPFVRGATGTLALGNLLITAFVKTSAGACVEIEEVADGCDIDEAWDTPYSSEAEFFTTHADFEAFATERANNADDTLLFNSTDWPSSETAAIFLDDVATFNTATPLVFDVGGLATAGYTSGWKSALEGNGGLAAMLVVRLDATLASGSNEFDIIRHTHFGGEFSRIFLANDRTYFQGPSASPVDIGPASLVCGDSYMQIVLFGANDFAIINGDEKFSQRAILFLDPACTVEVPDPPTAVIGSANAFQTFDENPDPGDVIETTFLRVVSGTKTGEAAVAAVSVVYDYFHMAEVGLGAWVFVDVPQPLP